jgi:hypothetical protein
MVAALGATQAQAQFNPVPLTPGSFTVDVVVEKEAPRPMPDYTTATMDGGTNNNSQVWYEMGFDATRPTTGVPVAGSTFVAQDNPNRTYKMPPSYSTNNALFLSTAGSASGTLTLATPTAAAVLSLMGSASGPGATGTTLNYTVHFQGGGTEAGTVVISDWFNQGLNLAWTANGRVDVGNGQTGTLFGNNPRLHYSEIFLSDTVNPVLRVELTTTTDHRVALFSISTSSDYSIFTPVDITGFNRDMVVEATAPLTGSLYGKANVIMNGGATNVNDWTWYEVGFNKQALATGIPAAGSNVSGGTPLHTFTMPPTYAANNAIYLANIENYTTGTLTLTTPTAYSGLSFFGAAGNGPVGVNITVHFADTTSELHTISVLDWFNTGSTIYVANGRYNPSNLGFDNVNNNNPRLSNFDITLGNTTSPVTSIDFSYVSGGRASLFAVAGQATPGGNFTPALVTGFNADPVVEASAYRYPNPLLTPITATMDGGTNFNGSNGALNTWYERGYFKYRPETGLPPAGSIITSVSLPDHHYQMPASYTGNNAVYVDAAIPEANITFATPAAYSALSFLSTCANGGSGVTNQCVIQYANGTMETNTFISYDWFANLPYAFTASGRTDVGRRTVNNVGSTNPKLFEAQFALGNTVSPVTNVVLRFVGAASPNARLFVFAVSATAGAVPPIISLSTISAPAAYEGSNVTFNAVITGGAEPIAYQWQKGTNGVYIDLMNGPNITGATTTNMVLTATFNDPADYRIVASNVAGSVNGGVVTLQQVLSTLPDITTAGDPIAIIAGTTPGGEPAANAINNNTTKYLNFDADGVAPFVGPVGFTIQPSSGNTIVSALRFYTANDADVRDPADYLLEGSLDGFSYTPISSGLLALPTGRNAGDQALNPLTQFIQEVRFPNTSGYTHYRLSFQNVRNNAAANANSMQIGEVEFLGIVNPNPPPSFSIVPTDVSANENANATFTSLATGPGPISYQWYDVTGGDPGVAIGGNNANLTLPNVTVAQSGSRYRVVATNPNGSTTSPSTALPGAELTVTSGAPYVTQDLPLEELGYAGRTLTLSAVYGGTAPTYQWQSNGVDLVNSDRVSGATSSALTIANLQPGDAATYQLLANNTFGGPVPTSPTTLHVTTVPSFALAQPFQSTSVGWSFTNGGGGGAFFLDANHLVLTTAANQQRAVWFNTPMQINAFKASFQYQAVPISGLSPADGLALVLQNSPAGTGALGGGGGGLGYGGLTASVALSLNIYGTPGVAFNTGGNTGGYTPTAPVNIAGGDLIQVDVNYDGNTISVTLSNTVDATTFATNIAAGDITSAIGGNLAYVGITAATGGEAAEQQIRNFRFIPIPSATGTAVGSNVLLSWPGTIGGYGVATSSTITGTYTPIPGFIGQTNGLNQKVVTPAPGNSFYRLVLPLP